MRQNAQYFITYCKICDMGNFHFHGIPDEVNLLQEVKDHYTQDALSGIFYVVFAGYANHLMEFQVQINSIDNHGYASDWPEWAYLIAKEALLHNKRIWVIFKDIPYGRNISHVLLLN